MANTPPFTPPSPPRRPLLPLSRASPAPPTCSPSQQKSVQNHRLTEADTRWLAPVLPVVCPWLLLLLLLLRYTCPPPPQLIHASCAELEQLPGQRPAARYHTISGQQLRSLEPLQGPLKGAGKPHSIALYKICLFLASCLLPPALRAIHDFARVAYLLTAPCQVGSSDGGRAGWRSPKKQLQRCAHTALALHVRFVPCRGREALWEGRGKSSVYRPEGVSEGVAEG